MKISNTNLLLIRACKKAKIKRGNKIFGSRHRVEKIIKRVWLVNDKPNHLIISVLGIICEKYTKTNLLDIIGVTINPKPWEKNKSKEITLINFLIQQIRFTEVKGIDGWISPKKFRDLKECIHD